MKIGFSLGMLTVLLIYMFVSISEFLYLKIRLKKYHRRLTIYSFLFKYYEVIHVLKSLEEYDNFTKAIERRLKNK